MIGKREVYYEIEVFCPAYEPRGWPAEWLTHGDLEGVPYRYEDVEDARAVVLQRGEEGRVVKVVREVVED